MLIVASVILTFSALLVAVDATSSVNTFVHRIKESFVPPRGWTKIGPALAHHLIELRIALTQSNFPLLEQHLYEVRYM